MLEDEWDAWRASAVREYAVVMQRNKGLALEHALAQAERENAALLSEGADTPGHRFFVAEEADSGRRVGLSSGSPPAARHTARPWHGSTTSSSRKVDRGQGFGRAMLSLLMEGEARAAGFRRIELNVFGDNVPAKHLYAARATSR